MTPEHVIGDHDQSLAASGHCRMNGVGDVSSSREAQTMHHHPEVVLVLKSGNKFLKKGGGSKFTDVSRSLNLIFLLFCPKIQVKFSDKVVIKSVDLFVWLVYIICK